jgi:hypothetical protein
MIIGILGFLESGKGSVGAILQNDYKFQPESFAKPLKDAAASIFGWERRMLEGDSKESREFREMVDPFWSEILNRPGFTPRLALQLMGTEAGRDVFGKDLWTASCIKRCSDPSESYVITDVRFRNEIKAVKDANGIVVRVKRGPDPEWVEEALEDMKDYEFYHEQSPRKDLISVEEYRYDGLKHYMEESNLGIHQSEWDWIGSDFDYLIENDSTLADLKGKVRDMLSDLKLTHDTKPTVFKDVTDLWDKSYGRKYY